MGMYDTIILAGPADAVRCAHGHEIRELQTKDLGEGMNTYYVWEGSLYRQARHGDGPSAEAVRSQHYQLGADGLVITHETRALPAAAGEIVAYSRCEACLPVLVEAPHAWGGHVQEEYPWVEYVLRFEGSRLWQRRPSRVESRDDVRRKNPNAIPDTDRVAIRTFERRSLGKTT